MELYTGVCKYCGQVANVKVENEDDADIIATESCDCDEAKKLQRKNVVKENLSIIIKDLDVKTKMTIQDLADCICDEKVDTANIDVNGIKITIKRTKEKVKVSRKEIKVNSIEV